MKQEPTQNMKMKRGLLILCSMLMALVAMAQKSAVSGTVVDGKTGDNVVGASVTAGNLSVVTNGDGYFMLKSDEPMKAIVVSHIGFRSKRIVLDGQGAENMKIRLEPTTIQLNEVLVRAENPLNLLNAAIKKIPENYSLQPELYHCFYREAAMKRQHYICVAEGVVDMYKTSYKHEGRRDRVAIIKGRRLLSPKKSDTLSVKVLGGPVSPVQLDIVKNSDLLLNEQELSLYELNMETPTAIADRMQYVISLRPAVHVAYPLYYGTLYIDQETLAFTRAELSLDMSDRQKATDMMLIRKPASVRFKPKELSLLIDYRQGADGLMRLSYIRTTFRFNCDWRRKLFSTSFSAFCELAVTSTTNQNVQPIRGRDSFDQRDAFFDKVDYFLDPTFWQDYNIIEPTETLDRAIHRLLKKNQ